MSLRQGSRCFNRLVGRRDLYHPQHWSELVYVFCRFDDVTAVGQYQPQMCFARMKSPYSVGPSGSTGGEASSSRTTDSPWTTSLYPTHVQLSGIQKGAVAVLSAFGAALDPSRADLVAALGETTGQPAFHWMRERMKQSASGRLILDEKPRITDSTLRYASILPEGTFGHAYHLFMNKRHFSADERPSVRFVDDPELAYVATRYREVHDLWHVLFGCHTSVLGELALKVVEFVQTGMPMTALSVLGANWRLKPEDRTRLVTELLPWGLRAGSRSADLMCLYYEKHFHEDLEDVRLRWRILRAPQIGRPMP